MDYKINELKLQDLDTLINKYIIYYNDEGCRKNKFIYNKWRKTPKILFQAWIWKVWFPRSYVEKNLTS